MLMNTHGSSINTADALFERLILNNSLTTNDEIQPIFNSTSSLFPTKITKSNEALNLTWNTNRLESINNISFVYDHFKRRVKKISGSDVTKYFYNGETYKDKMKISLTRKLSKFIENNNL